MPNTRYPIDLGFTVDKYSFFLLRNKILGKYEFICYYYSRVSLSTQPTCDGVECRTDDADSYVRATAVHVIGSLVCQSQLWISLLQISHLTEVLSNRNRGNKQAGIVNAKNCYMRMKKLRF